MMMVRIVSSICSRASRRRSDGRHDLRRCRPNFLDDVWINQYSHYEARSAKLRIETPSAPQVYQNLVSENVLHARTKKYIFPLFSHTQIAVSPHDISSGVRYASNKCEESHLLVETNCSRTNQRFGNETTMGTVDLLHSYKGLLIPSRV